MPDDVLTILQHCNPNARVAFVGIGSELRGDDAVGVVIINRLAELARITQYSGDARHCVSTAAAMVR